MRYQHIPHVFRVAWDIQNLSFDLDKLKRSLWGPWKTGNYHSFHCFTDDFRLESIWNFPEKSLDTALLSEFVIGPDFSLYEDAPDLVNDWQLFRIKQVTGYWQSQGVFVVPPVTWTSEYFNFDYIPKNSIIAVRSPSKLYIDTWIKGAELVKKTCEPKHVLHFGVKRCMDVWEGRGINLRLRKKI